MDIEAKIYQVEECGWAFSDLFSSRAERCANLEKKKHINVCVLSVIIISFKEIMHMIVQLFNGLSYVSQISFIFATAFCVSCILWFVLKKFI